jgi:hypothetical protein
MKTLKITLIAFVIFISNGCSEESVIEGLVPSKLVTVDLNIEVPATTFKTSTLIIDEDEYLLKTNYFRNTTSITQYEVYFNILVKNDRYFKFRGVNIMYTSSFGDVINQSQFTSPGYNQLILLSGYVFAPNGAFVTSYPGAGEFDKIIYIPFNADTTTDKVKNKNIYGWISAIVTKSKVTLLKMAYVKNTSINAGQEN